MGAIYCLEKTYRHLPQRSSRDDDQMGKPFAKNDEGKRGRVNWILRNTKKKKKEFFAGNNSLSMLLTHNQRLYERRSNRATCSEIEEATRPPVRKSKRHRSTHLKISAFPKVVGTFHTQPQLCVNHGQLCQRFLTKWKRKRMNLTVSITKGYRQRVKE